MTDTSWWKRAAAYLGDGDPTAGDLSEFLERQMLLQRMAGNAGDVAVPREFATLIVAALKKVRKSRSDPRISWNEHKIYDMLINKGKAHKKKLMDEGKSATVAEGEAAEWLHEVLPEYSVDKIQRDLQRKNTGHPYRR